LIYLAWICNSDWQEQIAAVAANAVEPDAMEPNAGLKVSSTNHPTNLKIHIR